VEEESNLPPGQALVRLAVEPTAKLLQDRFQSAKHGRAGRDLGALAPLSEADPYEVAYIAARVALNSAATKENIQTTSLTIANQIIEHLRMEDFRKTNKAGYKGFVKANQGRLAPSSTKRQQAIRKLLDKENSEELAADVIWQTQKQKVRLGTAVFEALCEATGLFTMTFGVTRRGTEGYIVTATEAVVKWLEVQHARCELLEPILMPMVVPPRRWSTPFKGGYLTRIPGKRLVKSANRAYQDTLAETDLTKVYEAVNHVQETRWRINRTILDTVRQVWDSGGSIAGLPRREDRPIPERPDTTDEDKLKAWKRSAAKAHEDNAMAVSLRVSMQQRLWIAEKFADEEAIWFPHSMDFRGRIYPIPATGIHPQADDLGKALLEFADGLPLGDKGGYWLAIHLANLFGVDKVSFRDRIEWTFANSAAILDSAIQPLDGARFWTTADSPWMALAACIEFAGYLEHKGDFVSHLPIPLDGSNSGLQHFSALLRDPAGAAAVNLLPSAEPQDVYAMVAAKVQAIVDASEEPEAAPWKGGKVTRKIAKRPVMTFVYSATRFGMQDMILTTLREIDDDNKDRGADPHLEGADNYDAARYLSHVIFGAIGDVVSAAAGAMSWLRDAARLSVGSDQPILWTTPDGLPVMQSYREIFGQRIQVHWQGRRVNLTLAREGVRLNARAQANGISPNFVHSLDAAHLRAVARAAREAEIGALAVIHDSFGTHAARTDDLVRVLRDTFVEQYTPDLLTEFRDELMAQLPEELREDMPELPEMGSLDLEQVRLSNYFFA
jgi:DNA-directed RNA polymerase